MDPVAEIIDARQAARQHHDPHVDVCFLATVTTQGRPEVRAVTVMAGTKRLSLRAAKE